MADRKNPVDVYVGSRLRLRRTLAGMSQEKLGEAVGLTFQQIQKYEKGANRIGASRLYQFSRVLDVAPAFFFEGILNQADASWTGPDTAEPASEPLQPARDPMTSRESLELMRAYNNIRDQAVRRRIFDLVKAVAERNEAAH